MNNILVVDCYKDEIGAGRVESLVATLNNIAECVHAKPINIFADKNKYYGDIKNCISERVSDIFVIFTHGGEDQHFVSNILKDQDFKESRFVLYHGGGHFPLKIDEYFQSESRSNEHAFITETFDLKGLTNEQKESVKKCVDLLIKDPDMSTREAVEQSFGRPELNEILEDLYKKLYKGVDENEIIKERDEKLNNYFRKQEEGYTE